MKDLQAVEKVLLDMIKDEDVNIYYRSSYKWIEITANYGMIPGGISRAIMGIANKYDLSFFIDIYKDLNGEQSPRIVIY